MLIAQHFGLLGGFRLGLFGFIGVAPPAEAPAGFDGDLALRQDVRVGRRQFKVSPQVDVSKPAVRKLDVAHEVQFLLLGHRVDHSRWDKPNSVAHRQAVGEIFFNRVFCVGQETDRCRLLLGGCGRIQVLSGDGVRIKNMLDAQAVRDACFLENVLGQRRREAGID